MILWPLLLFALGIVAETGLSLIREPSGVDSSIILVSCLDGRLVALDRATGREQWTSTSLGGALLSGSTATDEEDRPDYLIEPLFPGHLYLFPSSSKNNLIRVSFKEFMTRESR